MDDHAHLLLSLPSSLAIATAMRNIKSGSSRWMHEEVALHEFEWQEGYGAFSIGEAQVATTIDYISSQQEHHRKRDFQAEFIAILKKHRIGLRPGLCLGLKIVAALRGVKVAGWLGTQGYVRRGRTSPWAIFIPSLREEDQSASRRSAPGTIFVNPAY